MALRLSNFDIWYNKQPIKASPAPVVSIGLTLILGMICLPFGVLN